MLNAWKVPVEAAARYSQRFAHHIGFEHFVPRSPQNVEAMRDPVLFGQSIHLGFTIHNCLVRSRQLCMVKRTFARTFLKERTFTRYAASVTKSSLRTSDAVRHPVI